MKEAEWTVVLSVFGGKWYVCHFVLLMWQLVSWLCPLRDEVQNRQNFVWLIPCDYLRENKNLLISKCFETQDRIFQMSKTLHNYSM